jgi:hypothetical protein
MDNILTEKEIQYIDKLLIDEKYEDLVKKYKL